MASQGPLYPGTADTSAGASGDNDWLNPGNVSSDNGSEAQITAATFDANDDSYDLRAYNLGFSIPAGATINGVVVEIDRRCFAGAAQDGTVVLIHRNPYTVLSENKATATAWPTTSTVATYGSSSDLWNSGGALTVSQINNSLFGVSLIAHATGANTDIGVDFIRVTVYYTEGLTAGKDLQLIWNMRAVVGKNLQALFNVRAVVGKSLQTIFNVRTFVGKDLQAIFHVRAAAGKSLQTLWNLRQIVGKELQAVWNVLGGGAAVGRDLQAIWHVRAGVGKELQSIFHVRALAGKDLQAIFHVRALAGRSLELPWNVRAAVQASTQLLWHVRVAVGAPREFRWHVRAPANATIVVLWNVAGPVGTTDDEDPESRVGRRMRVRVERR